MDEARHTVELPDSYVIKPVHGLWPTRSWSEGMPCPEGFSYASDTNKSWMNEKEMRAMVADLLPSSSDVRKVA